MRRISIDAGTGRSEILIGESLGNLRERLPQGRCLLVTDPNVRRYWGHLMDGFEVVEVGLGETLKTLQTVEGLYEAFLDREVDRSTFIVAVGGGIVCDVAGFAASTFLRGLEFGFVASTLLAQVDASVGGKNGVNVRGFKNLVGVFRQPAFVLCDFELLSTLPGREYACGLAEMVKAAAIASPGLFAFLERRADAVLARDVEVLEQAVHESVSIKAAIVRADETERGERKKLNFGHTLGHAIESTKGLPHGEAVSLGMVAAAELSVERGLLAREEAQRLVRLLERLGLPTSMPLEQEAIAAALLRDKKRQGSTVDFVLLEALGRAVCQPIPLAILQEVLG